MKLHRIMSQNHLLNTAAEYSINYLSELKDKRVFPDADSLKELQKFSMPLPEAAADGHEILRLLNDVGSKKYSDKQWRPLLWFCIRWNIARITCCKLDEHRMGPEWHIQTVFTGWNVHRKNCRRLAP